MSNIQATNELFNTVMTGEIMASIIYGMYAAVSLANIHMLSKRRTHRRLLAYTIIVLAITTAYEGVASNFTVTQLREIAIPNPNLSPEATSDWPDIVINVLDIVNTWIADGFIVYRCYVTCVGNRWVYAGPIIVYIASIGVSIAFLWSSVAPGATDNTPLVETILLLYWSLSVAVTVLSTVVIVGTLFRYRRHLVKTLGEEHGKPYATYMSMTVESAAIYAIWTTATLVSIGTNSVVSQAFMPILGNIQVLAPSLIILRITLGISFDAEDYRTASQPIQFASSNSNGQSSSTNAEYTGNTDLPVSIHFLQRTESTLQRRHAVDALAGEKVDTVVESAGVSSHVSGLV